MADDPLADVSIPAVGAPVPVPLPDSLPLPATSAQVAQFVAYRAAACVGADYANLALLDGARTSMRLFHDSFLDRDIADRYTDVAVDATYPIAAAVREERVVLLADIDAYRAQFPDIVADTIGAGVRASASLPLYRSDGTVLGALAFAWTDPTVFNPKLEAALRAVGVLCVETVERAERYDADHELVVAMQRRLLGDLPSLPGIDTAARYLPATASLAVGGDWYEGLVLGNTRMALVVGDITGHGIAAAADMALVRGMVSALLHSGVATSDVFSELSAVLSQRSALLLATAALVVVDIEHDTVTFATAGHPPPLLRLPDGEVRRLDSAHSPIIGVPGARRVADVAPFPKGSKLVMYTDGLVERRDRRVDEGIDLAESRIHAIEDDATGADIIEALIGELINGHVAEDDIALLVIHHTGRSPGDVST
jgi:serine phosphatase RsbU (regulator of sigma subunit)